MKIYLYLRLYVTMICRRFRSIICLIFEIYTPDIWLSLKRGLGGCGHGFGGYNGFSGFDGPDEFDGISGFDGLSGFDGFSRFDGFSGFGGFGGFGF